jgi:hypothetical protein
MLQGYKNKGGLKCLTVKINVFKILDGKLNGSDTLENTGMKENIIFKLTLKKYDEGNRMFIRGRTTTRMFCCKSVLDFLSSIICKEFIVWLRNQKLLTNGCVLRSEIV